MNRLRTCLVAMACALALTGLTSVAHAQGRGPGGGGPPPGFGGFGGFGRGGSSTSNLLTLTLDPAVWEEIKITDEQLGKVTRLKAAVDKQARISRDALRSQSFGGGMAANGQPVDQATRDAARNAARLASAENSAKIQHDTDAALQKILKAAQFARVKQIDLRVAGPLVVARPDVADALNLSPDQRDQINNVIAQLNQGQDQLNTARREMFSQMGGGRGGRGNNNQETEADAQARRAQFQQAMEKMRTDTTSLKDKAIAQIARILSKTQRTKFNNLLGKGFDLSQLNDGRGPSGTGFNPGTRGPAGTGTTGTNVATTSANATAGAQAKTGTGTAAQTKTGTAAQTKAGTTTSARPGATTGTRGTTKTATGR